jgi:type IV pilus assembly protein PilQ
VNIKSYSGVVAGVVASTVLVAPAQGANVQVQGLEVRPVNGRLELELNFAATGDDDLGQPRISTSQRDRTLITEIANANLDLAGGQKTFTQENPLPGIERLEVTEPTPGNVRIVALGAETAPTGELLSQDGDSILLNMTAIAPTEATPTSQSQVTTTIVDPQLLAQSSPNSQNDSFLQPTPIPPFLPRASAPPIGDISVSTTDTTLPRYVNLQTNAVVPRLVLKQAPAEDVMSLLARTAGINLVVSGDISDRSISLDIENEPVQKVFDYVLMLADLKAVMRDRTVFVGKDLPDAVTPKITRTMRLNQASVFAAQCYLRTGSDATKVEGDSVVCANEIEEFDPMISAGFRRLRDLFVNDLETTLDNRLNAMTLTGEPRVVEMATNLLTQLDARRRQVAVNVKILDVTLSGNRSISSDLKLLIEDRVGISAGDGIIVSPNSLSRTDSRFSAFNPDVITVERGNQNIDIGQVLDSFDGPPGTERIEQVGNELIAVGQRLVQGTDANGNPISSFVTFREGIGTLIDSPTSGRNFIGNLVAGLLRNTTSKIVADPTLIIQESQIANVNLTDDIVIGTRERLIQAENGTIQDRIIEPVIGQVGLQVQVAVERIDDNGFITMNIQPSVSSVSGREIVNGEPVTLRRQSLLQSGSVRLRDDQTLLLAGVIDERDIVQTSKVPILGDIPILGSLFRSSSRDNSRRELLFIITPQVIDDSQGAMWGYGYQPTETAREMLEGVRFPTR